MIYLLLGSFYMWSGDALKFLSKMNLFLLTCFVNVELPIEVTLPCWLPATAFWFSLMSRWACMVGGKISALLVV